MEKNTNWKNIKNELLSLERNFVSDTMLYNEINQMLENDKYYRTNASMIRKIMKDSTVNIDSLAKVYSLHLPLMSIGEVDSINYQKLLHIIETKGFPLSPSIKYHLRERQTIYAAFHVMLIHFSEDSAKVEHLKPILLQYIKQGDCPPELFAIMIDAYQAKNRQLSLYGVYSSPSPERVFEFKKLNERRKEIGLPDYELSRKIIAKKEALNKSAKK